MKIKTVNLTMQEIIDILDPINPDAFNLLNNALQEKVINDIGEDAWLKTFDSDEWNIKLSLNYEVEKTETQKFMEEHFQLINIGA
jgi:hypothetical protein